jgi:hypothetical protein
MSTSPTSSVVCDSVACSIERGLSNFGGSYTASDTSTVSDGEVHVRILLTVLSDSDSETLAWLKTHHFRDVNVPVLLRHRGGDKAQNDLVVELNKEIGVTPLMAACRLHHVALVRALLDQDAVVFLTTANGDTAMHFLFHDWYNQQPPLTTLRHTSEALVRADHTLCILQMLVRQRGVDVNGQVGA